MMFRFTDEQQRIRDSVREFTERKVAPLAQQIDKNAEIPWELRKELAGQDYFGRIIPRGSVVLARARSSFAFRQRNWLTGAQRLPPRPLQVRFARFPSCYLAIANR